MTCSNRGCLKRCLKVARQLVGAPQKCGQARTDGGAEVRASSFGGTQEARTASGNTASIITSAENCSWSEARPGCQAASVRFG